MFRAIGCNFVFRFQVVPKSTPKVRIWRLTKEYTQVGLIFFFLIRVEIVDGTLDSSHSHTRDSSDHPGEKLEMLLHLHSCWLVFVLCFVYSRAVTDVLKCHSECRWRVIIDRPLQRWHQVWAAHAGMHYCARRRRAGLKFNSFLFDFFSFKTLQIIADAKHLHVTSSERYGLERCLSYAWHARPLGEKHSSSCFARMTVNLKMTMAISWWMVFGADRFEGLQLCWCRATRRFRCCLECRYKAFLSEFKVPFRVDYDRWHANALDGQQKQVLFIEKWVIKDGK